MGFEALSRGAIAVTLVEKSSPAYKALISNKQLLQADKANILHQDALQFLNQNTLKFNIIFLDPPYNQEWLPKLLPLIATHLHAEGLVYVEAEYALDESQLNASAGFMADWQIVKQNKAGNVFYHLLKAQKN